MAVFFLPRSFAPLKNFVEATIRREVGLSYQHVMLTAEHDDPS